MATGSIRVTPEELVQRAGEFEARGIDVAEIKNALDRLASQLETEWEGQSSMEFISLWRDTHSKSFDKIVELCQGLNVEMKGAANIMDQADRDIAAGFSKALN